MTASVVRRVSAGVEWLDANDPGWWRTDADDHLGGGPINLAELVMSSACRCVLGQRFGNYFNTQITTDEAVLMGFDATYPVENMAGRWDDSEALRAEWTRVIEVRRETAGAVA